MHPQPSPIAPAAATPAHRAHTPLSLYLILVCLVGSTGGFLFGFDTSVISGVIEYIANPRVFNLGEFAKGWTVSCIIIGCMIGCVLAGPLSSRFGRKKTLLLTALVFLASSLGCACPPASRHSSHSASWLALLWARHPCWRPSTSPNWPLRGIAANWFRSISSLSFWGSRPPSIPIISCATSAALKTGAGCSRSWPFHRSCSLLLFFLPRKARDG